MSYPKYEEPKEYIGPATVMTFVIPRDYPSFAKTHMMVILKRSASDRVEKHFVEVELFNSIMAHFLPEV